MPFFCSCSLTCVFRLVPVMSLPRLWNPYPFVFRVCVVRVSEEGRDPRGLVANSSEHYDVKVRDSVRDLLLRIEARENTEPGSVSVYDPNYEEVRDTSRTVYEILRRRPLILYVSVGYHWRPPMPPRSNWFGWNTDCLHELRKHLIIIVV